MHVASYQTFVECWRFEVPWLTRMAKELVLKNSLNWLMTQYARNSIIYVPFLKLMQWRNISSPPERRIIRIVMLAEPYLRVNE